MTARLLLTVATLALIALLGEADAAERGDALDPAPGILATQPGATLTFEVGNALNIARIDREGISSIDVKLRRSGDSFRGRVGRQRAILVVAGNAVTGKIGEWPVRLVAARSGDALTVTGAFGARTIGLTLGLRSVGGRVGPCRYDLAFDHTAYRGAVVCGGRPEAVRLAIPATLAARTDAEIAALMTPVLVL